MLQNLKLHPQCRRAEATPRGEVRWTDAASALLALSQHQRGALTRCRDGVFDLEHLADDCTWPEQVFPQSCDSHVIVDRGGVICLRAGEAQRGTGGSASDLYAMHCSPSGLSSQSTTELQNSL